MQIRGNRAHLRNLLQVISNVLSANPQGVDLTGCQFIQMAQQGQVDEVLFDGLHFEIDGRRLRVFRPRDSRWTPMKILEEVDKKGFVQREKDANAMGMTTGLADVPNFWDIATYGEVRNIHDYLARFKSRVTPHFWDMWIAACRKHTQTNAMPNGGFSGNDVGMHARRYMKDNSPHELDDYKVSNSYTAYLMRLAVKFDTTLRSRVNMDGDEKLLDTPYIRESLRLQGQTTFLVP